ncbi:sialate O-acetylesterase [Plebeiibacterium sediminum]|uniref:Sialate O-acetylesterase n=1 Tax=Plebeiibacterium sediminum TaxID=2992112 RepID=A0AAE3M9Q1_9BACT|nr:sialate O-acetylesterase [Plebeiobacterium sediminum]MCW3789522.1 sialate O-acetylesterase [Plebeiobacterium sediminum]
MKIKSYKGISMLLISILFLFAEHTITANVSLPSIFGNHMVMQQNADVKLWGWGKPFENIKVTTSWSNDTLKTVVNNNGHWSFMLHTPKSGETHHITIQGYNKVVIDDILMGEVWLCSGQSNMEWCASYGFINSEEEIKNATHEEIRLFHVNWRTSPYRCIDVDGEWIKCTPETMKDFSAIGYFFGRELNQKLNVPVGLISSNWGGTPVEAWIPSEKILGNPDLNDAANKVPYFPWAPNKPGYTFNSMIAPIIPFTIKGVLWYQGEANVDNSYAYTDMLKVLVKCWREEFKTNFAFHYAQIAPFKDYQKTSGVEIRDAQRRALDVIPNSNMIVVSDIGDTTDIHPRNKIDAGKRFAYSALNKTYGLTEYPLSGPLFKDYTINGNKVEVSFKYSEGLHCTEKELKMFEVAGKDLKWYPAKAVIKNDKVIVSSKEVKAPVHVRLGWTNSATLNLFNKDNLPASSFTTEEWSKVMHSL